MTDSYKIWKPEHDGHAPPNWREGMKWGMQSVPGAFDASGESNWSKGQQYQVEPESLAAPNEDAKLDGWTISGALSLIRAMSPDELAKHGITLAPEKDWATELWADLWEVRGSPKDAELVRNGQTSIADRVAIDLIRTRFEQMIAERSKRDD
jgi:hypothetical protein